MILSAAMLSGAFAAYAAYRYLAAHSVTAAAAAPAEKSVQVLVPRADLRAGDTLGPSVLALRPIPVTYAPTAALGPAAAEQVFGRRLRVPVHSGEPLTLADLAHAPGATFSGQVAPGRRAMTIPVDELNSIAGTLVPGDHIDILDTSTVGNAQVTHPVLQDVSVLATGGRAAADQGAGDGYATITLDLSPEQSQVLASARADGRISVLLRNPTDPGAATTGRTRGSSVAGASPRGRAGAGGGTVPVLSGGSGGSIPVQGLTLGETVPAVAASTPGQPLASALAHLGSQMQNALSSDHHPTETP